jgi:hypothetical protein
MDDDEKLHARLESAQWILERQLAWISAADVKVGALIALHTALLGGLAAAFTASSPASRTAWAYFGTLTAAAFSVIALVAAGCAVRPQTEGPDQSLMFFGRVTKMARAQYFQQLKSVGDDVLIADCASQIHRNAEIASDKYEYVSKAIYTSFVAGGAWILAIALLVKF